jgi:hypothetical protein
LSKFVLCEGCGTDILLIPSIRVGDTVHCPRCGKATLYEPIFAPAISNSPPAWLCEGCGIDIPIFNPRVGDRILCYTCEHANFAPDPVERAVSNSPPACPDIDQDEPTADDLAAWQRTLVSATMPIRQFVTGANRDVDTDKLDFEGFLSPLVVERFAQYMHKNRRLADGSFRDSDNWQKGIPLDVYMKSGFRHFIEWWKNHRESRTDEEALCGILFNTMGYLHEILKNKAEST